MRVNAVPVSVSPALVELLWAIPLSTNATEPPSNTSGALISDALDWGDALLSGDNTTGGAESDITTPGTPPSAAGGKHLEAGKKQYVGCLVDGGYPRPLLAIIIGTIEVDMSDVDYSEATLPHDGVDGYEVSHYRQRADHTFDVTWQYDLRTVKCMARTSAMPDILDGTTMHVKGCTRLTVSS